MNESVVLAVHLLLLLVHSGFIAGLASFWSIFAVEAFRAKRQYAGEAFLLMTFPSVWPLVAAVLLHVLVANQLAEFWYPSVLQVVGYALGLGLGIWGSVMFHRRVEPWLDQFKATATRRTSLERNRKTDVREIYKFLPSSRPLYDPLPHINRMPVERVFLGLDEHEKEVTLDYQQLRIQHILLAGRTRSGKGVAAQILIPQLLARGEFVVVLDPKVDNWMPHVFKAACEQSGVPYRFVDLRQSAPPQCNPFAGCDEETLENMLVGGFGLTEKGEAADFYRLADRKAARECAAWLARNPGATARDALSEFAEEWAEQAPAFRSYMSETAELDAVNAVQGGIDIADGEKSGGMLYVVGDMINPRIVRMQRMILLRLLFLAKNRNYLDAEPRTICVFADEFKVHISRPFMTSLGASAGWGMHCILAFQSLEDLRDCPADLDKDMVRGAVTENCAIQLSYRIKDPDTANWLSRATGTILVDDETRTVQKNVALAETVHSERRISQSERQFVDVNMFLNLPIPPDSPASCGVVVGAGPLAQFAYTSPIRVERSRAAITPICAHGSTAPINAASEIDVGEDAGEMSGASEIDV